MKNAGTGQAVARWLNRDPIEEYGGINLYAFVANNPIDGADPFGLAPENPFHGFDPDKLKDLLKDPTQCEKANELIKSFEEARKHAEKMLKDPNTKNPDRYRRFIDEMNRRTRNLQRALPEEPPSWWRRLAPIWRFPIFFLDPCITNPVLCGEPMLA